MNLRQKLERHLDELPLLPSVIGELMGLHPSDDSFADDLIACVQKEPNFTTRLIAAANSAASSPLSPITTLRAAVTRIGAKNVMPMILSFAVIRVFVPRDDWEKSLWRHALHVAIAARALAARCGMNPEEAYTCGLLHDLGRFVLFKEAPEELRRVDEGDWTTPDALVTYERSICGMTHTEIGALACERWKLPTIIRDCVRDHHTPGAGGTKLVALIRLADIAMFPSSVPGAVGLEQADDTTLERVVMPRLPPFLHVGLAEVREIVRATVAEANEVTASLGIA